MDFLDILRIVFLILHFVGLASLLGGFMTQMKAIGRGEGRVIPAMFHGVLTMLVSGIVLAALASMGPNVDHAMLGMKLGIKLAVAIAVAVVVIVFRKKDPAPKGAMYAIGGLTLLNIVVAVAVPTH